MQKWDWKRLALGMFSTFVWMHCRLPLLARCSMAGVMCCMRVGIMYCQVGSLRHNGDGMGSRVKGNRWLFRGAAARCWPRALTG